MQQLLEKLEGDLERVGFVLKDGEVVEVTNHSETPEVAFRVSMEDIEKYENDAIATWHTHPGSSKNLSVSDFYTFLSWPHLDHYIVGVNGVQRYYVDENGDLLCD